MGELRGKSEAEGGQEVVTERFSVDVEHDLDTKATVTERQAITPAMRDAFVRDALAKSAAQRAKDEGLKGRVKRKARKDDGLKDRFSPELPAVQIRRPAPLKESNPLRK